MKKIVCLLTGLVYVNLLIAQQRIGAQQLLITNEDSLNRGKNINKTVVSGYGSAFYQRDFNPH